MMVVVVQVSAAKGEAAVRERDVRSLGAEKAAAAAQVAAAVARDKQEVEARLAQALQVTSRMGCMLHYLAAPRHADM